MIANILNTDIKFHFPLLKEFQELGKTFEINKTSQKELAGRFQLTENKVLFGNVIIAVIDSLLGNVPSDLKVFSGLLTHAADFGGSIKPFAIARMWSERVDKEFSAQVKNLLRSDSQYALEIELQLDKTPYFKDLD